jgi:transcriptional repressor NrdR|tara:strand:- start:102 stop:692 length:591 start_codon:yes stop_codon:yes gene_type:complete
VVWYEMICSYCNKNQSKVLDSRDSGNSIRRRRECINCGVRFTTYEFIQAKVISVIKRDARREDFDVDKLKRSLWNACKKRPIPIGSIDKLVSLTQALIIESGKSEIPSRLIGELVMTKLKEIDRVAYIRFASVYRDFKDVESFKDEVDSLLINEDTKIDYNAQLSFLDSLEIDFLQNTSRRKGLSKSIKNFQTKLV